MKDRLVKILLAKLNDAVLTVGDLENQVEHDYISNDTRVIAIDDVVRMVGDIDSSLEAENKYLTPKTKFLYVEDGSVDLDALEATLFETNPEIKVIVYKQGSRPPILSGEREE